MKRSARIDVARNIDGNILLVRRHRVMLDRDLARLYGVTTSNLNKAVKRNRNRFPADFMFQLTVKETEDLIFQFGTSNQRGGSRHLPYAFTQEGIAMLSSVLRSDRAVRVNITIMRAFIRLREMLGNDIDLARRFGEIESMVEGHDAQISEIIEALRLLMPPPSDDDPKEIGFHVREEPAPYRVTKKKSKPA